MVHKCPTCGEPLQATRVVEHYFTLVDGKWKICDSNIVEERFYCASDHPVAASDVPELTVANMCKNSTGA